MKFSVNNFSNKCEEIHRKLQICSNFVKKFLIENFRIFAQETDQIDRKNIMAE